MIGCVLLENARELSAMKAWLHVLRGRNWREPKSPLRFHIVFDRQEAIEIRCNEANEVIRGAEREYPDYLWEKVKVSDMNGYVVEGTKK
jgi:hypothetical protein